MKHIKQLETKLSRHHQPITNSNQEKLQWEKEKKKKKPRKKASWEFYRRLERGG